MGIQLDWEVEAEGGWQGVGEDQQAALARRRRNRRLRNWLLAILALAGLIAAGVTIRLRQANEQARAMLEATIAAETLALRIGDRAGFLALQSGSEEWQRIQGAAFDAYQALGPRVAPGGEIVELEMQGRQARAVLRERLDGQPTLVTWFYAEGEQGWQHVPPRAEAWGEPVELASAAFDASFYAADRAFVDALLPALDAWWEQACRLSGCSGRDHPRPQVHVVVDPLAEPGWAAGDPWTLVIPSPLLGRAPEHGPLLDAELSANLTGLIAARWAETMVQGITLQPAADLAWVESELAVWLRHSLDGAAPPSDFFNALAEAYGPDSVPGLLAALRRDDRLVPALQSLTGLPAADLPVDWRSYLAHRLQAETRLIAQGRATEAGLLFGDLDAALDARSALDFATELQADPDSITVASLKPVEGAVLAEVRFNRAGTRSSSPVGLVAYEPFRLADEGWVHTAMAVPYWGAERMAHSEHFTLVYYDLDASAVEGMLAFLEVTYPRLAEALSVPADGPAPHFLAAVTPLEQERAATRQLPGSQPLYTASLRVSSPHGVARPYGVTEQEYVQASLAWELAWALAASQAAPMPSGNPVVVAVAGWALGQIGVGEEALAAPAREVLQNSRTLQVLIDLLVDTYGQAVIPRLAAGLPAAHSTDEWLAFSIGLDDSLTIRAQWHACLAGRADFCPLDE